MNTPIRSAALFSLFAWGGSAASAQSPMTLYPATEIQWKDGPPSLPRGAKMAVLEGDPSQPGMFTIRFKFPDGFQVGPHYHSQTEHATVIAGVLHLGMGERFDRANMRTVVAGSFGYWPAGTRHYAWAEGETILQLHGQGPWTITYVNPADDPRRAAPEQSSTGRLPVDLVLEPMQLRATLSVAVPGYLLLLDVTTLKSIDVMTPDSQPVSLPAGPHTMLFERPPPVSLQPGAIAPFRYPNYGSCTETRLDQGGLAHQVWNGVCGIEGRSAPTAEPESTGNPASEAPGAKMYVVALLLNGAELEFPAANRR